MKKQTKNPKTCGFLLHSREPHAMKKSRFSFPPSLQNSLRSSRPLRCALSRAAEAGARARLCVCV